MAELGWATEQEVKKAKDTPIRTRLTRPPPQLGPHFLAWVRELAKDEAPDRIEKGRGVVVETTLDPSLQRMAENATREWLDELRHDQRGLRAAPLSAALVALDATTGAVLAEVSGDTAAGQPGL